MLENLADHRTLALLFILMTPLLTALRLAFPKIPDRFIPLMSLGGGLLAGAAHALISGASLEDALFSAAIGMAGGGASVAVHQSMKQRPPSDVDPKASSGPPTPRTAKQVPPSELARVAWATVLLVAWGVVGVSWAACTAGERQVAGVVAAGAVPVCEGILVAAAPEIAALCTDIPSVEAAIAELVAEHSSQFGSTVAGDAGPRTAAVWRPSMAEVHRRLAAKRAKDGGK
jgi:hypothetical protein